VLITTRLRNWSGSVQVIDVDVLAPDDAAAFLLERTEAKRRVAEDDEATALLIGEDLGHLALALEQAGAYISQRRLSFASYRSEWQQRRAQVLAWNEPRLTQYPASLAITWLTSFEQLGEEARTLLRRLAWLSPAPIPESLLEVPIAGEAANPGGAFDALVELEGLSLLNRSCEAPQFVVHRLVQEVTRLRQELAQEPDERVAAFDWIYRAFIQIPQNTGNWNLLEQIAPHAELIARLNLSGETLRYAAFLLHQIGVLRLGQMAFVDAERLLLESVSLTGDFYGKRSAEFSACLANLANTIIRAPGCYSEAIDLLKQALDIAKECHGENSAEAARIYTNLGFSDSFSGRVSDASEMLKTAEDIFFKNNLNDKEILAIDYSNMSKERYLTGKEAEDDEILATAESFAFQAVDVARTSDYANASIHRVVFLQNLAGILKCRSKSREAEKVCREALTLAQKTFPTGHPFIAQVMHNLASTIHCLAISNKDEALLSEAESLAFNALAIFSAQEKSGYNSE
jgi:hypothetical protein